MGVRIFRPYKGKAAKWYLRINFGGQCRVFAVGSEVAARKVADVIEAEIALSRFDLSLVSDGAMVDNSIKNLLVSQGIPRDAITKEMIKNKRKMILLNKKIKELTRPSGEGTTWSKKYDRCTQCKTTEFKHNAKGLCTECYKITRRKKDVSAKTIRRRKLNDAKRRQNQEFKDTDS